MQLCNILINLEYYITMTNLDGLPYKIHMSVGMNWHTSIAWLVPIISKKGQFIDRTKETNNVLKMCSTNAAGRYFYCDTQVFTRPLQSCQGENSTRLWNTSDSFPVYADKIHDVTSWFMQWYMYFCFGQKSHLLGNNALCIVEADTGRRGHPLISCIQKQPGLNVVSWSDAMLFCTRPMPAYRSE